MVVYINANDYIFNGNNEVKTNYNSDEYGDKLPTRWTIKPKSGGRELKVYAICWSNACSHYVIISGKRMFIRDCDFPS